MTPVIPSFRHNGSRIALIRDEDREGGAYIFVELEPGDGLQTDLSMIPYPNVDELIAICAEVATDANRRGEDASFATARASLLPGRLAIMSNWLVGVGRTLTTEHDDHFDDLMDWFDAEGGDAFPGERRILQLLMAGKMSGGYRIGSKTLHYDSERKGFYAVGKSRVWSTEELLHLVMLVLSDEYTVEQFKDQGSPFLVLPLRKLRPLLSEEQLTLLASIEAGEEITSGIQQPSLNSPVVIPEEPTTGSILEQVIVAGNAARPSEQELEEGLPDLRQALQDFRAAHLS